MDLHRVRRLADVLVVSQLRSGRSTSNPKSFLGRSVFVGVVDAILFALAVTLGVLLVGSGPSVTGSLDPLVVAFLPFVPLIGVAAVLVAGVMFELTATMKFSASDAVNWMPLGPGEYVAASAAAIAYTYSPAIVLFLGGTLPFAASAGVLPAWILAAVLAGVSLFEGAFLVEMVRAATQRTSSVSVGRRGHLTLVLRAVLLIVVILSFQLAFNPVILLSVVRAVSGLGIAAAVVPFFWGTEAVLDAIAGSYLLAVAFAGAMVLFSALLLAVALRLRGRYWVVSGTEIRLEALEYAAGHPWLRAIGLSPPEAALVSKDLRGYVRRRELLPLLVVPVILIVLVLVEGQSIGVTGAIVWAGWVAGFFALLLAVSSIGQERRALQSLFAFPLTAASILRAKAVAVLLPSLLAALVLGVAVGVLFGLPIVAIGALVALTVGATVVLGLWGLVFASRYSDFQDRPRPQYLRPSAMLAAMGSGMIVLFAIVIPGAIAIEGPLLAQTGPAVAAVILALGLGALAFRSARTGFDRLFRELPF